MTSLSHDRSFDPEMISGIAREVIRRLRESEHPAAPVATEKLITIETLNRYADATEMIAADRAVVTPAAREEAARRGIKIVSKQFRSKIEPDVDQQSSSDALVSQLVSQLARRGVALPTGVEVVWTEQPAAEVYRRCSNGGRAAMVACLSDVERFARELSPSVWVLDGQKLNLVAAVNVAARIAKVAKQSSGDKP